MARFLRGGGGRRGGGGDDMQMNLFSALGGGEGVRLEEPEKIELGAESIRMVLPRRGSVGDVGEGKVAPEVASEVRSAFSGEARKTGGGGGDGGPEMVIPGGKVSIGRAGSVMAGKPLPPTGIFRRPEPEEPVSEGPADKADEGAGTVWEDEEEGMPRWMWARAWLAGVEWNRKTVGGLAAAMALVAVAAIWSARGCGGERAGGGEAAEAAARVEQPSGVESLGGSDPAADATGMDMLSTMAAAGSSDAGGGGTGGESAEAGNAGQSDDTAAGGGVALTAWSVPGTKAEVRGGSHFVVFEEAVFESKDAISVGGMRAIRALAAKLKTLEGGAKVLVTGYTDNQPLTRPTAQFASNEDIAMARAVAAADHLKAYARNKGLEFECVAGKESEAPYPNDTPANRKRNRTVTVRVTPGK